MQNEDKLSVREFEATSSKMVTLITRPNFIPIQDVAQGMKILTVRLDGKLVTYSPELALGTAKNSDEFVVGDIDSLDDIEQIFSNARYREMKKAIDEGIRNCKTDCNYFGACGGGWPSNKYFENGKFSSTETTACDYIVKSVVDTLNSKLFYKDEFKSSLNEYIDSKSINAGNPER